MPAPNQLRPACVPPAWPIAVYGDGRQSRDFSYVGDVVEALRAAARATAVAGCAYNVGGGSRVSLTGALELLARLASRPLDVRRRGRESGDVMHTGADIARARAALGFDPATSLEDGLRAELQWVSTWSLAAGKHRHQAAQRSTRGPVIAPEPWPAGGIRRRTGSS